MQRFRQKLEGLVLGYKTRRILKSHKVVCAIKQEYDDLIMFANGLKQELSMLMFKDKTKHSSQLAQVRQLLDHSGKDQRQKRH